MGSCFSSNPPASGESSRNIIDCHLCNRTFEMEKRLGDHLDASHPEAIYKCFKCVRAYITKAGREAHIQEGECTEQ
ncbi:hypothetical protein P8452_31046 [Trifolium repens]|nr:hypothetical protein P8452_31046 [Trifolium repens]